MRVVADLQVHSPYSRATSQNMTPRQLDHFAGVKGLGVIGTGDLTHPVWRKELSRTLEEVDDSGLYRMKGSGSVFFMVTGEVNTTYTFNERSRRVHHCLLAPSIDAAEAISDRLSKFGNLASDGRPTLQMTAPELVDHVLEADRNSVLFPAHAWTPWFSLFGANSGFDSILDCYQERANKIFALETGMSSDPPMNWRLSQLDRLCLVSNSDAHSAWPWRIGREANVFELEPVNYQGVVDAIRSKDPRRFLFTIETHPDYGKYHWTGHRDCQVSMSARQARDLHDKCPKCGKMMTRGVEERVEELADRPPGFTPPNPIRYRHLLPLSEVVGAVIGEENPASSKVWDVYNALVGKFGSEYNVMLDVAREVLTTVAGPELAEAILKVRNDEVFVEPGYDGVYGRIDLKRAPIKDNRSPTGLEAYV